MPKVNDRLTNSDYGSNWAERHVAYVAGLGTFGLSNGLITKIGTAGRFVSLITNMEHEVTKRDYNDINDYCNMCRKGIINCPADAISFENGKDHTLCNVSYIVNM